MLIGAASLTTYTDRVRAKLGALPQEIRVIARQASAPRVFESVADAAVFLDQPDFDFGDPQETYVYQVTYTDGSEFD